MMSTLKIKKADVYKEVAKTTSYTGSKMDPDSYNRIFTTDADQEMLDRFWVECKSAACNALKRVLSSESEASGEYSITLNLSSSFDDNLLDGIENSLFSFFVMSITSKWFAFTNKGEAEAYAISAATFLDDVMQKVFYKTKPTRPKYN